MISESFESMQKRGDWVVQTVIMDSGEICYEACHLVDGKISQILGTFPNERSAQLMINNYLFTLKKKVL